MKFTPDKPGQFVHHSSFIIYHYPNMCNRSHAAYSGHSAGFRPHFGKFGRPDFSFKSAFQAPVNIVNKTDLFELELYLSGKSREDFTVEVSGKELTIGYKAENPGTDSTKWVRKEFHPESFERIFLLDDSIDTELITARYENGILIVLLPIKPESRRKSQKVDIS